MGLGLKLNVAHLPGGATLPESQTLGDIDFHAFLSQALVSAAPRRLAICRPLSAPRECQVIEDGQRSVAARIPVRGIIDVASR